MYPAIGAARCSSRWCPTAEQVKLLEELYKGGLTNPSTGQIHQIVAHLSRFGNIQGKNVFYWFQNHKARDKQRIRKKLVRHDHQLVGLEKIQCSKNPNCFFDKYHFCSSSVSPSNNDHETLKRIVLGGEVSNLNTNARCCGGGIPRIQDRVWSNGLKLARPQPNQLRRSCDRGFRPPLVTLDLFPVTPMIKEVECTNNLSRNYLSTINAPQLLPNPNLTLGAFELTNY